MDALTFLGQYVPLFAGVSEQDLTPLAANSTLKNFAAGQTMLYMGMSVEALHVVAVGKAVVSAKGKTVAELTMGQVFGEASILENSLAGATVKAGEAGAVVLLIPESHFRHLVLTNEEFAVRVRALVAARRAPPPKASTAA